MNRKQKKMLARIIIASIMLISVQFIKMQEVAKLISYIAIYLVIGYDILIKTLRGIFNGRIFDENFLMTIATLGAFALAIYTKSGDYNEGIAVMLFYQIGEFFQSYALRKSRKNISALMDIRPDYANIEENGKLKAVDPNEVEIGSIITVQPGEKVPIDGVVTEGSSTLNTGALTGESIPKDVISGDDVISGCINMTGVLKIRTTKNFGESTVSKILTLVENASSRKSRSEAFISRFAKIYTPIVCISALLLAVMPPLVRMFIMHTDALWEVFSYRALIFLVVSCPCALVISVPLSFFAGIGGASKEGILIKGSNYLEALSNAKYTVFDKTGTLTKGVFEVTGIYSNEIEKEKLIEYAALAECASSHPISKSLQKAYGKKIDRNRVSDIKEIGGHGILAKVDGKDIAIGNEKMMKKFNIDFRSYDDFGTVIHIGIDGKYAGSIVVADVIKPDSKKAISDLKKSGVEKTIMLTGDSKIIAEKVANDLSIDEVYSELLPNEKVEELEKLFERKKKGHKIAFVGDGINDAPVLSRADIGIAMGAMGSDAAIEAADVVLMDDNPMQISKAIRISKKCIGIVKQNIIFALTIKFACLILSTFGLTNMWFAIFADVGVMVLAVLNAIRALKVHNL